MCESITLETGFPSKYIHTPYIQESMPKTHVKIVVLDFPVFDNNPISGHKRVLY